MTWQKFYEKYKHLGYEECLRQFKLQEREAEEQVERMRHEKFVRTNRAVNGAFVGGGSFPRLPSPVLTTTPLPLSIHLSWTDIDWAANYMVEIDTVSDFSSTTLLYFGPNLATTAVDLIGGQTYYFRIKALNLPSFPTSQYYIAMDVALGINNIETESGFAITDEDGNLIQQG